MHVPITDILYLFFLLSLIPNTDITIGQRACIQDYPPARREGHRVQLQNLTLFLLSCPVCFSIGTRLVELLSTGTSSRPISHSLSFLSLYILTPVAPSLATLLAVLQTLRVLVKRLPES